MELVVVNPHGWRGGDESLLYGAKVGLLTELQKLGVNVTLLTLTRRDRKYTTEVCGVKIIFCPASIEFLRVPAFLDRAGFTWEASKTDYLSYKSALSFFREIKRKAPDVVHLNSLFLTNLLLLPLLRISRIPTVISLHDILFTLNPLRGAITRVCLKQATKIIVGEDIALRCLVQHGFSSKKIVHMPIPTYDKDEFYPMDKASCRKKLNLDENGCYLLYVGTIYPEGFRVKDPFELLYVLKELKKMTGNRKKYKLLVVGSGNVDQYAAKAEELDVYRDVIMTREYVRLPKLAMYYSAADVFLWPYPQESFGAGAATVEAAACGLPIVSYSGKSVRDEDCIVYVPYRDRGAMARKILELLNDNELRDRLVKNSARKVKEHSCSGIARKLKEEYEKILVKS